MRKYYNKENYKIAVSLVGGIILERNDGQKEEIKTGEKLHFLNINEEMISNKDDYIWEFFYLNENF